MATDEKPVEPVDTALGCSCGCVVAMVALLGLIFGLSVIVFAFGLFVRAFNWMLGAF